MNLETISTLEKHYASQLANLYANTIRFQWNSEFLEEKIREIQAESYFRKLPRYAKSFINGVIHMLEKDLNQNLVYSYEINGKRVPINCEEFRKIPAKTVYEKWGNTGAFVYKEAPHKIFQKASQ